MFYAIVDRDRYRLTLNNGCILLIDADGPPHYYFSVPSTSNHGERATSISCRRRRSSRNQREHARGRRRILSSRARSR